MRVSADALRISVLVGAGLVSGYLWRAAFEPGRLAARPAQVVVVTTTTPAPTTVPFNPAPTAQRPKSHKRTVTRSRPAPTLAVVRTSQPAKRDDDAATEAEAPPRHQPWPEAEAGSKPDADSAGIDTAPFVVTRLGPNGRHAVAARAGSDTTAASRRESAATADAAAAVIVGRRRERRPRRRQRWRRR